jgi:hypothetical protein
MKHFEDMSHLFTSKRLLSTPYLQVYKVLTPWGLMLHVKHEKKLCLYRYNIKQKKSINVLHWGMPLSLGNTLLINFLGKKTPKCK